MSRISYITDFDQWKSEFIFSKEVQVRFSETDMYGHLNNTVPFTYFEMARIEFFKEVTLANDLLTKNSKSIIVVADLQCDYLQQVFFDDVLKIYVKVHRLGTSSIDIHYLALKEGIPCFTGRGTIVHMDKSSGKSVPWDDSMREKLAGKYIKV